MIKLIKKFAPSIVLVMIVAIILFLPDSAFATSLASQVRNPIILRLWRIVLGLVNIAAILGLIFIALVNILRLNIETFNVRRMLPSLILGIIFANFSHLICRIPIDFAQLLTNFFIQPNALYSTPVDNNTVAMAFGFGNSAANATIISAGGVIAIVTTFMFGVLGGFLLTILFAFIIIGLPTILVAVFAVMMYIRLYVIWFLVILSPIAFFGLFFEPIKMVWTSWWGWFAKWLFLAPVGFFFLRLAVEIGQIGFGSSTGGASAITGEASISSFATWAFGLGMIFFALYVPFTWGGSVMGAYKGMLGKAWAGYGWGKKIGGYAAAQQGKRWKALKGTVPTTPYGRAKNALGKAMIWGGKGAMISPIKAAAYRIQDVEKEADEATRYNRFWGAKGLAGPAARATTFKNMGAKMDPNLDTQTLIGLAESENVLLKDILEASQMPDGENEAAEVLRGRLFARLESGDETARVELEKVYAGAARPTNGKDGAYHDRWMNWGKTSYRRTQQVEGADYSATPLTLPPPTPGGGGGGGGTP